jgi:hypothetical protein
LTKSSKIIKKQQNSFLYGKHFGYCIHGFFNYMQAFYGAPFFIRWEGGWLGMCISRPDTLSRTELYMRRGRSLQKAEKNTASISWSRGCLVEAAAYSIR